jgi:STE24 endopeptidase
VKYIPGMRNQIGKGSWWRWVAVSVLLGAFMPLPWAVPQTPTPAPPLKQAPDVATALPRAAPARISAYTLPPELYRKAHRLYQTRFAIRVISTFYGIFVFWLLLQAKWAARFRDWAERVTSKRFVQVLIFTPLLVLAVWLLQLPLDLFSQWLLKRYGISVQSWGSWFGDWGKSFLLTVLFGSLLVWLLYVIIRRSAERWWLYFWIISLPLLLLIMFASPYVIDPLFNKYEPLASKAPQLIPKLQEVTRRAGQEIPVERMFWMNASDKTIGTNASVNGFGASKRIIIWDTTLAQETDDEVLADFGHEMGHYVLGHLVKGFFFFAAVLFVLFYLGKQSIGWLLARQGSRWGVRGVEDLASLPALLLLVSVFGIVATVIGNSFSRYMENQADVYGLEVTHGIVPDPGQACARSFQKFGETVFVEPNPNPMDVLVFFDHPPVRDRIHLCVTYDPWSKGETPQFVK